MNEQQKWERRYWRARREHAYRMRIQGLTLKSVGLRLGVTPVRVSMMLSEFEREQKDEARVAQRPFSYRIRALNDLLRR